ERLELLAQDRRAAITTVAGLHMQDDPVDEAGHPISLENPDARHKRTPDTRRSGGPGIAPAAPSAMSLVLVLRPDDVDDLAANLHADLQGALGHRDQRAVAATADQVARVELRAALADQDLAGIDQLTAEPLHAEPLRVGVATVARAGRTLLVCHLSAPYFPLL